MNEQAIQDGYKYFKETGYNGSLEDYIELMATNPDAVKDTYTYFKKTGYNGSEEDFSVLFGLDSSVKKKDPSDPQPVPVDSDGSGDQEITESLITEQEGVGSSDYLQDQNLDFEQAEVKPYSPIGADSQMQNLSVGEKSTAIERAFGKNTITDLFGDMYRAGVQGQAQGGTVDESLEILGKSRVGAEVTSEDIADFLAAQQRMQNTGVSDEMKDFDRIYQKNGGGAWGWLKGVWANPSTIPQLFVSSMSAMINPATLAGAGVGAASGAALGTAGGVFAPITSSVGAVTGAFMGASITLETALTFGELLQKEVLDRGLELDEAGVRQVLESKDAMSSIRNKSAARGVVIGAIDGIASRVGIKVGARTLGKSAYGVGKKIKAIGQVAGIEAVGGSLGEIGGRLAADQEMDAAEVLFEGVAGTATLPGTIGLAALKSPKYYINKSVFDESQKDLTRVNPEVMEDLIYNSTDEEFAAAEITIKNNPELEKVAAERKKKIHSKSTAQKEILDANPKLSEEKLNKLVPLQQELNNLEGNKSQAAKKRRAEIIAEMDAVEEAKETKVKDKKVTDEKKEAAPETKEASPEVKEEAKDLAAAIELDTEENVNTTETETEVENTSEEQTEVEVETEVVEEKVTPAGNIFSNNIPEGENKIKNISDIENIESNNPEVKKGKVSVSGQFSEGYQTIVGDSKSNKDRRTPVTKKSKVKDGIRIEEDVDLVFDEYTLDDGSKVFSLVNPNHRDSAGRAAVYGVNLTYDVNSPVTLSDVRNTLIQKMNKITSEITGVEIKTNENATTKQSPTKVDGQKQAKPVSKVPKRDTGRKQSTRKKDSNQNEQQKKNTQKKAKVKELKAVAPNAYVNESDSGSRKSSEKFIKPTKRALAALKRLAPEVMVVIHETEADYQNSTGNNKQRSAGLFNPTNNIIHINADLADVRVLQHEVFHAILLNKLGSESKIAALTDRMMKALAKSDLTPEVKKQIDDYLDLYKEGNKGDKARLAFANEEYMAEVFSFLANNMATLKAPEKTIVQKFLSKLSNLLGLTAEDIIATDKDMIDLINVIAGKVQTGETITKSDVKQLDLFAGGKDVKNPSAALKTVVVGGFEVSYTQQESVAEMIKKGLVTEPKDLSFLQGKETVITAPDDMLAGEIKYDGKVIFEGEGGVFFVTKFSDVWASGKKGTANTIKNALNEQVEKNGKAYLTLTKGSDAKLVSSASGVNSTLAILNTMLDNKLISASNFRSAVSSAVKKAGGSINLRQSAKDLKTDIQKYFTNPKTSTFEKRGDVVRDMVGEIAKNLPKEDQAAIAEFLGGDKSRSVGKGITKLVSGKPGSQALVNLVAQVAAEGLTKGLKTGDIYAVVEINSPVTVNPDSHPSYPFHISLIDENSKPILHLPQNRESGNKVLVQKSGVEYKVRNVSVVEGSYKSEVKTSYVGETQSKRIFNTEDTVNDLVAKARGLDYSEASIFEYLRNNRKLSIDEARAALEQKDGAFTDIPMEFTLVEGGINEGQTLFNEISYELNKFLVNNPKATRKQIEKKAFEILRSNEIFKAQDKTIRENIEVSYKGVLGKVQSVEVNKRISRLKRDLFVKKQGQRDLRKIQLQLKQLIRNYVPKEAMFTKAQLERLLNSIITATPDSILSVGEKIFDAVERKRSEIKFKKIDEIKKIVKELAKSDSVKSKRPIAKNIEGGGVAFFKSVREVLQAALIPDAIERGEKLLSIATLIDANEQETQITLEKQKRGEALTLREQTLLARVLAFDTFQNIYNLDLEAVTDILQQMKDAKTESIAALNMSRLERAEVNNEIFQAATDQIRQNYPELFKDNGNGDLKTKRELDAVDKGRFIGSIRSKISNYFKQFNFTSTFGIRAYLNNRLAHLGTLMNMIDNVNLKNTFFYDSVYQGLNRMHTKALRGYYNAQTMVNSIAASIDGINSYQDLKQKLDFGPKTIDFGGTNYVNPLTGTQVENFSVTQLMRIYALSKNKIQAEKLEASGFGKKQMKQVEEIIGTDAMEFVDKIVQWLSTDYFNSINNVYKQSNYTDLGFVENYFPTKSISSQDVSQDLIQGGQFARVFTMETAPSLKNRTDEFGEIDVDPDFIETLENHISQMERYKAYALGVKNLQAIFKVPAVNTLMKKLGIENRVYESINLAINPQAGMKGLGVMGKLQRKFTGFALSFKAIQLVKQSTSFINAFEEYKGKGSLAGFMLGMAKVIAKLPYYMKLAQEISPDFKDRLRKGLEGDLYRLETGSRTTAPVERRIKDMKKALSDKDYQAFRNKIITLFMKGAALPTVMGDIMGVMGYMVNYEANIANGMSKAKAAEAFNNYNATQQSRRETDKIPLQQSQSELTRAFTMFGSTLFLQINKVMSSMSNMMKALKLKKRPRSQDVKALALNFAGANVMFALAANMFKFLGDDKDEEEAMNRIKDAMYGLNLVYQIPLFGAAAQEAITRAQGRTGFSDDVTNPYKTLFRKMNKGIAEGRVDKSLVPLVEIILGAQTDPFVGIYNFTQTSGKQQEEAIYDIFGISSSYQPGTETVYSSDDLKRIKKDNPEMYEQIQQNKKLNKKGTKMSKSEMKIQNPEMYEQIYGEE